MEKEENQNVEEGVVEKKKKLKDLHKTVEYKSILDLFHDQHFTGNIVYAMVYDENGKRDSQALKKTNLVGKTIEEIFGKDYVYIDHMVFIPRFCLRKHVNDLLLELEQDYNPNDFIEY